MLVQELPPTLHTMHMKVGLPNGSFKKFIVCIKCSSIYEHKDCVSKIASIVTSKHCTYTAYPHHPHFLQRQPCDTVLLKSVEFTSGHTILYPHSVYCYKSLKDSLQELLLNTEFVSNCQLWKKQSHTDCCTNLKSIYDGNIWKEFFNVIESPSIKFSFSTNKYSFGFSLNVDWFQPYTHTTYSVGTIYITILNLPRFIRYKKENVILIGIIPGPREPKKHLNTFLQPLVDELQQFWNGINLTVHTGSEKRSEIVKGALLCVTCDLPAGRKVCGFLGHTATLGCSKCSKRFPGDLIKDYSGFNDIAEWPKRTNEVHRENILKMQLECGKTKAEQKIAESKYGCRYSCLLQLPYFDAPRMLCIDPMHNLFLGTGKHMLSIWMEQNYLMKSHFLSIQEFIDAMVVPSDIGRIPSKIASNFSGFTADQFKNWIMIYSIPALFHILRTEQLECWRYYVLACRILCKQSLSRTDIEDAQSLLLNFCTKVESFYGKHVITPNMHLHGHYKEMLFDYGPSQELWLFSYERYNGILGSQPNNNKVIEPQLMQRFIRDNYSISLSCPNEFREEFAKFDFPDRIIGSVRETLMPDNVDKVILPSKYSRKVLDRTSQENICMLYCKIYPNTRIDEVIVNSIIMKYESVCFKGKTFSISRKKDVPYIVQAQWNENLFGTPPTSLPRSDMPTANIRPINVKYYFNATFKAKDKSCTITFAHALWLLPHSQRHAIGEPAELWNNGLYECRGSYIPIDHLLCRCAHGLMQHHHETLMVVIPIVE